MGAALAGLMLVALAHWQLTVWTEGRIVLRVMQLLLYPYAVLVTIVGLYIASLPRAIAAGTCHQCGYDLSGLPIRGQCCPECGVPVALLAVKGRCGVCRENLPSVAGRFGQCAACQTPFRLEARPRRVAGRRVRVPANATGRSAGIRLARRVGLGRPRRAVNTSDGAGPCATLFPCIGSAAAGGTG